MSRTHSWSHAPQNIPNIHSKHDLQYKFLTRLQHSVSVCGCVMCVMCLGKCPVQTRRRSVRGHFQNIIHTVTRTSGNTGRENHSHRRKKSLRETEKMKRVWLNEKESSEEVLHFHSRKRGTDCAVCSLFSGQAKVPQRNTKGLKEQTTQINKQGGLPLWCLWRSVVHKLFCRLLFTIICLAAWNGSLWYSGLVLVIYWSNFRNKLKTMGKLRPKGLIRPAKLKSNNLFRSTYPCNVHVFPIDGVEKNMTQKVCRST